MIVWSVLFNGSTALESLKLHRKRFADERRGFAVEDRRHKKYLPKDTAEVESAMVLACQNRRQFFVAYFFPAILIY